MPVMAFPGALLVMVRPGCVAETVASAGVSFCVMPTSQRPVPCFGVKPAAVTCASAGVSRTVLLCSRSRVKMPVIVLLVASQVAHDSGEVCRVRMGRKLAGAPVDKIVAPNALFGVVHLNIRQPQAILAPERRNRQTLRAGGNRLIVGAIGVDHMQRAISRLIGDAGAIRRPDQRWMH